MTLLIRTKPQFLFGTGDTLAQHAVEQRGLENHDVKRTGRMVFYGGCTSLASSIYPQTYPASLTHLPTSPHRPKKLSSTVHSIKVANPHHPGIFGPAATTWFAFLQRRIVLQNKNLEILAKVLTDQCVFASTNLFCFLSTMAVLEGSDPKEKLQSTYTSALARNWMLWPPVQTINFKFVPLEHRVLVVNVVSLGWNCYLSWVASQGKPAAEVEREEEEPWR